MTGTFLLLILVACGINSEGTNAQGETDGNRATNPDIEGYVVDKSGGRILVVDPNPQDFSSTGGVSEFYDAIWFSNADEAIKVGEKVQVWFDAVAESYPGQAKALKTKVIQSVKPNGADLTEAEAIQKALVNGEKPDAFITVIVSTEYDAATDIWKIFIKYDEETEMVIEVPDIVEEATNRAEQGNI